MSEEASNDWVGLPEQDEGTVARVSTFRIKRHGPTAYKVRLKGERGGYEFSLPPAYEATVRGLIVGDPFKMEVAEDILEGKPVRFNDQRKFTMGTSGNERRIHIGNDYFLFSPKIKESSRATSDVVK